MLHRKDYENKHSIMSQQNRSMNLSQGCVSIYCGWKINNGMKINACSTRSIFTVTEFRSKIMHGKQMCGGGFAYQRDLYRWLIRKNFTSISITIFMWNQNAKCMYLFTECTQCITGFIDMLTLIKLFSFHHRFMLKPRIHSKNAEKKNH